MGVAEFDCILPSYVKRTMFLGHSVCIGMHEVKEMKLDSNLLIIRISIVLTECCSFKLFINPVSEQGNSYKE